MSSMFNLFGDWFGGLFASAGESAPGLSNSAWTASSSSEMTWVNPATGLPMVGDSCGGFDVGGNLWGHNNAMESLSASTHDMFSSSNSFSSCSDDMFSSSSTSSTHDMSFGGGFDSHF